MTANQMNELLARAGSPRRVKPEEPMAAGIVDLFAAILDRIDAIEGNAKRK